MQKHFWKNRFLVILGSFWGHFGVILGHFGSFWAQKSPRIPQKSLTWPQTTPHGPKPPHIAQKMAPYTIMGPKKVLKMALEAKITAENAFSDLGAHTNVVRGALILPLVLVWSRLADIDFWPQNRIFSHFAHYGKIQRHFQAAARPEAKNVDFFKILF